MNSDTETIVDSDTADNTTTNANTTTTNVTATTTTSDATDNITAGTSASDMDAAIGRVSVEVQREIIRRERSRIGRESQMKGREFEERCLNELEEEGYEVEWPGEKPKTDQGWDLTVKADGDNPPIIIQCVNSKDPIGPKKVRDFAAVLGGDDGLWEGKRIAGILVSTSEYSRPAKGAVDKSRRKLYLRREDDYLQCVSDLRAHKKRIPKFLR